MENLGTDHRFFQISDLDVRRAKAVKFTYVREELAYVAIFFSNVLHTYG